MLTVSASDTEHVAETRVQIHVSDENDQWPVFSEGAYSGTLLELTGPGQEVGRGGSRGGGGERPAARVLGGRLQRHTAGAHRTRTRGALGGL